MVIKVKSDLLKSFLKKTTANGLIEECKLVFGNEGLKMCHTNSGRNILISGLLQKSEFGEYEKCDINIKNTNTLLKVLDTFGSNELNIVMENNMVRIMNESGGIDLALAENVETYKDTIPELEYDNSVIIKRSLIDTISKRNDIIKSEDIILQIADKQINFSIGDKIDKANVFQKVNSDVNVKAIFEFDLFNKVSSQFDEIIDVSLSSEQPSRFVENGEKFSIDYYIMCSNEEE